MSDAFLHTGDGGRFRLEPGQRHAFACDCCGTVHMMAFDTDPRLDDVDVLVMITSDPRAEGGARGMVAAIRGSMHRIAARWNRSS